ncbi:MAG: LamG domain-containing protein [Halioglobus sp.]
MDLFASSDFRTRILWMLCMFLTACSGGSGGGGSERQIDLSTDVGSSEFVYNGPAPASAEIQNFKISFYDPLAGNDRCGECHTPGGPGETAFVDQSDVNNAWQQARTVVNLNDPGASAVVSRVASGHNCWLGAEQTASCATTVSGYVERWAADASADTSTVKLSPRTPYSPSGAQVLPARLDDVLASGLDLTAGGELADLLRQYCAGCHSDSAPVPQVPFFASDNDATAYESLRGKVNLSDPDSSRLVLRLSPDSHNCWSNCADNANTVAAAITRLADAVPLGDIDPGLLTSTAAVLATDGIVANAGGRYETDLIAKWEFREGSGSSSADTSGVQPEISLSLSGEYSWIGGWGVRFVNGKAQGGTSASAKLFDRITASGEYTLEAWVAPANVSQEEAWIFGYAGGPDSRNLLLSQSLYNYESFNRSTVTDDNNAGEPALTTDDDAQLAQASLQHVVVTYDPVEGRRIYVNGEFSGDVDSAGGGLLNNWSEAFAVVLGNTTANTNPWSGNLRMAAVHNRALNSSQILQNFEVGVGQKFFVMFSLAEALDQEGVCHEMDQQERTNYCYVVFEVSQFDGGSYLFNEPFFANINPAGGDVDFDLRGIRLGINGKLARIGQGFTNVSTRVNTQGPAQLPLSTQGSIIPLENGSEQDVFFLAFDQVAGEQGAADDGSRQGFKSLLTGEESAEIGVRTFDEINASLSVLTGVPTASAAVSPVTGKTVAQTFASVRRALPAVADFNAFQSSHQMAATQLTAAYCDALVQDPVRRSAIFPGSFDITRPVADPAINWRNEVVTPLVDRAINANLLTDADRTRIIDEVLLLITDNRDLKPYIFSNGAWVSDPNPGAHDKRDGLIYCRNDATCPLSRTADVVKAACTAVMGSAVVLLQ